MENEVSVERKDSITIITLHRPERRNAVDGPTAVALARAFEDFERDEQSSVAVLYGKGGTFCSGADLKAFASETDHNPLLPPDAEEEEAWLGPMGPTRMQLSKPVIAAISGYAVAGGLELALWCDLRVMEETATFGVFCRRWGVPLIDGGTFRLPRLIGHSRAMDLILTGRPVDAEEALHIGLANRVVPEGQALVAAVELAEAIARFPQQCMRHDRLSAIEQWSLAPRAALANEFRHGQVSLDAKESLSGAKRFASGKGRGGDFEEI